MVVQCSYLMVHLTGMQELSSLPMDFNYPSINWTRFSTSSFINYLVQILPSQFFFKSHDAKPKQCNDNALWIVKFCSRQIDCILYNWNHMHVPDIYSKYGIDLKLSMLGRFWIDAISVFHFNSSRHKFHFTNYLICPWISSSLNFSFTVQHIIEKCISSYSLILCNCVQFLFSFPNTSLMKWINN